MDHLKKSFSRTGAKIWNSIPNSGRVLPKKSWPLNILIQEDTYVGVRTLIDILRKYYIFGLISFTPYFIYLFSNICILCLVNLIC